jgi:hypothetical protein
MGEDRIFVFFHSGISVFDVHTGERVCVSPDQRA